MMSIIPSSNVIAALSALGRSQPAAPLRPTPRTGSPAAASQTPEANKVAANVVAGGIGAVSAVPIKPMPVPNPGTAGAPAAPQSNGRASPLGRYIDIRV